MAADPEIDSTPSPDDDLPKMTFLDHLEELRRRLVISAVAVAVAFFACWAFAEPIFALLQ